MYDKTNIRKPKKVNQILLRRFSFMAQNQQPQAQQAQQAVQQAQQAVQQATQQANPQAIQAA